MNPRFGIRKADLSDKAALLEIETACFKNDKISSRQMHYLLSEAKAVTFVIYVENRTIGYCLCLAPKLNKPARIYSLAILPAYQKQGLAYKLLDYAINALIKLGYSKCRLEVSCNNESAKQLYLRFGFYEIEDLRAYYEDNTDGVRMEKILLTV